MDVTRNKLFIIESQFNDNKKHICYSLLFVYLLINAYSFIFRKEKLIVNKVSVLALSSFETDTDISLVFRQHAYMQYVILHMRKTLSMFLFLHAKNKECRHLLEPSHCCVCTCTEGVLTSCSKS